MASAIFFQSLFPGIDNTGFIALDYFAQGLSWFCGAAFFLAQTFEKLSNSELIKRCAQPGNQWNAIWMEFQERFGKLISLYIYRAFDRQGAGDYATDLRATIKDLRQDVYLNLLKNKGRALKEFKGATPDSFYVYLHTISVNVVKNYIKQMVSQKRTIEPTLFDVGFDKGSRQVVATSNATSEELELHFFREHVIEALRECYVSSKLERDISIFKLHYFEGLSAKELLRTGQYDLSYGGIENIIQRTKNSLRDFKKNLSGFRN